MAGTIDDSQQPYGNHFNLSKRFSKVLFRPGRPALSSELLELQSIQNNQLEMLGDSLFQEGAIISGMEIIPKPDKTTADTKMPNSFSVASLFANNSKYSTGGYVRDGRITVTTEGNLTTDVPSIDFTGNVTQGLGVVVSFTISKNSGNLNKINLVGDDSKLELISWTVDGNTISSSITDLTNASALVLTNGNQVNLNDGSHKFVVKYRTKASGSVSFKLAINAGYDPTSNVAEVNIDKLYIEDGNEATDWKINSKDSGTASDTERVKDYTVRSGRVYLNGAVREFDQQDFSIKGTGREEIGLRLDENIVTASDDPSLLDDTPGAVTKGEAGADRLHYNVALTYQDASATPFVVFQDNVLNQRAIKPDYSNLEPILAKRTYDQSGSFRSYGFEAHLRKNPDPSKGAQDPTDANKILLDIDAGQAYVQGYSISTSKPTTLKLDVANQSGTATNEGFYYRGDGSTYQLINQPVKKVIGVTYTSRIGENGDYTHTRPAGGGVKDTFTNKNVTYIRKVWDNAHEYEEGKHFTYVGNTIYWGVDLKGIPLPNANDLPTPGQSYNITYDYATNAKEGTDYRVVVQDGVTSIDIDSMKGAKPVAGSTINVTYSYFTARIDMIRITMDQANPFKVVPGQAGPINSITPPVVDDPLTLELGYVYIEPNSHNAVFTMQTITRITFESLQQWGHRLDNAEYNMALNYMQSDVKRSEDPVVLKDAFADSFATIANRDDNNSNVAYDFENGEISIPAQAKADLSPNMNKALSNISLHGKLVRPPYHEVEALSQSIATGVININEFNIFSANGNLTIDPAVDNWIDTKTTTDFKRVDKGTINMNKWWRHMSDTSRGWYNDGRTAQQHAIDQAGQELMRYGGLNGVVDTGAGNTLGQTGWMIGDGGTSTTDSLVEYMRSKKITFKATNFRPLTDGYTITIDGTPVQEPTPENDNYKGTKANTFKADNNGEIHGTFVIPGGSIRCGTRVVKIVNGSGDVASTNYTANGTLRTTTNVIEKQTYTVNLWDPLAQSFYLQETRQLSSIDLYFMTKPASANSNEAHRPQLIVQIRELGDTQYPNRVVRAEQYLDPEEIHTSKDGSVATRITFDDPVTLKANEGYAVVLISDSNEYTVFKATKGETVTSAGKSETGYNTNYQAIYNDDPQATGQNFTITSTVSANVGDVLGKAPNSNGDLFISNNGMTWTADGASSLKFRVNVAEFLDNGQVVFDPIIMSDFNQSSNTAWDKRSDMGPNMDWHGTTPNTYLSSIDRLVTLTNFLTYQNTAMHWYMKLVQQSDINTEGSNDLKTVLDHMQWKPLVVNNNNKVVSVPGTTTTSVPKITTSNNPQQLDGELALFQNTYAIQLMAEFTTDRYIAPILTTESLSLVSILTGTKAHYESINLDESGDAAFNKVKIQYDAYIPNPGAEESYVLPMYSVDGGNTWYNFPEDGGKSTTLTRESTSGSKPTSTKRVSPYFTRYIFQATVPNTTDQNHRATQFKVRLNLHASSNFRSPKVRRLSGVFKYDV